MVAAAEAAGAFGRELLRGDFEVARHAQVARVAVLVASAVIERLDMVNARRFASASSRRAIPSSGAVDANAAPDQRDREGA